MTTSVPAILGGEPIFRETVPISSATLPDFGVVEARYRQVFASGMVTNSRFVRELEERAAAYLGVEHAVAVSSCTAGLLILLKALGLQGEVVLPSFTFAVTGHVLAWNGLRPVFADIDPETCVLDPATVEAAITPATTAILGVHIWGNPCPASDLQRAADRHGLPLLFDAAQALGSRYQDRPVGRAGVAEVFSLSPTKLATSAEGGIIATNDRGLAARLRVARTYGDDGSYDCLLEGINARMSELHAVLGLASLDSIDAFVARRASLVARYRRRLGSIPGLRFQRTTPGCQSNGVYFTILVDADHFGLTRDQLHEALKAENVDTRRYYVPPLHRQRVNRQLTAAYEDRLPHTNAVAAAALTLPLFSHMTEAQVDGVCDAMERLHEHREAVARHLAAAEPVS